MSEDIEKKLLKAQISQMEDIWQGEFTRRQNREDLLESELLIVKECLLNAEKRQKKEVDLLRQRVKTADSLLSYLKSKARIMSMPRFGYISCGIKCQEGVGFVDKKGVPMSEWCKDVNLSLFESSKAKETEENSVSKAKEELVGSKEQSDEEYTERIATTVMLVTDVMEVLLKRTIIAETEIVLEKKKASASQDQVKKKALQIESMWARVEEMEKVAKGTSGVLKEMQQKLEDMEQETSRQRQRATENEQELCRVRHDFEVLRSSIDNLVGARESLLSSEKRIQEMEKALEGAHAKVANLESVNKQKGTEVCDLLKTNDRLRASLDLKESELTAMREQCKILTIKSRT
ncbi:hypothetical protein SUGI_0902040 [Cryptomeria japonica]|uniref:uncharacterized protein LOC131060227 n=1 Tax=Cryptomeria japonica TaxID=3369 RepID=UPI0024147AFB|nr:uncharacterized protein LOC131060227 [Cryptomeria japonica]XP_057849379.1 uncharacterized protein LOC131060227 [Cryptomeria japonica]GLJ43414.1 hypothetical protein SUGI_0902040 [Cryptomeria japonica]